MSKDSSNSGGTQRVSLAQTLLLGGGAGLVLYALSPGPAMLLAHYTGSEVLESAFVFLFTPLKYLHDRIPVVEAFYDAYFQLCAQFLPP